jgi:hypothetical protein
VRENAGSDQEQRAKGEESIGRGVRWPEQETSETDREYEKSLIVVAAALQKRMRQRTLKSLCPQHANSLLQSLCPLLSYQVSYSWLSLAFLGYKEDFLRTFCGIAAGCDEQYLVSMLFVRKCNAKLFKAFSRQFWCLPDRFCVCLRKLPPLASLKVESQSLTSLKRVEAIRFQTVGKKLKRMKSCKKILAAHSNSCPPGNMRRA